MKRDQHASPQGVANPSISVSDTSVQASGFPTSGSRSSRQQTVPISASGKKKKIIVLAAALGVALATSSLMLTKKKVAIPAAPPAVVQVKAASVEAPVQDNMVDEDVDKALQARKHWSKYITAQTSNYGYGMLGGINNLSVLLSNRSDYPVDEMVVKVSYIKGNGKPWKTKFITAHNLAAHTEKKQQVPKVNRGKSVEISIHKVVSKKMQLNFEGK